MKRYSAPASFVALVALVAIFVAAAGCRVVRTSAKVTGTALKTGARVVGHAAGATASVVCLKPRKAVKHVAGAAQDAVGGAACAAGHVLEETADAVR